MSDKLDLQTPDIVSGNIEKIAELFPNCVTESPEGKCIDFDLLKQELSGEIVEGTKERYRLEWPGKREAIVRANVPTTKTLRPVVEDSVDFENTENLYIEGDNLEVLKCLQESYLGKVKMIYIDPPYNTGKDFVYKDNFTQDTNEFNEDNANKDEDGNRLVQNPETAGRYHSDWLTMMYPRLKLARNLLSDDGVVFISIDDNEVHNLRKVCDEIFGEGNFIANVIWERAFAPINLKKHFSENHDFVICISKSINDTVCNGLPRTVEANGRYKNPDNDYRGNWQSDNLSVGPIVKDKVYEIITPGGRRVMPPNGRCWLLTKNRFKEFVDDNRIWFGNDGNNVPRIKRFYSEVKNTVTPFTIWKYSEVGHSQNAAQKLKLLFDGKDYFDYPKSIPLIERMIQLYSNNDSIILDFFSGSATTAHAVMQLNAEDGGKRKHIMVQLPELTEEKSEAYKAGYKNICEIGKERIRRAAKKIKEETKADIDYGFRVYKLDSSNMQDVYYKPQDYNQGMMDMFVDNVKPDRTAYDLLTQVMLDWGLQLSLKIEETTIEGKQVFKVAENSLIACFDNGIDELFAKAIAKEKPLRIVFHDNSFANDTSKENVKQLLKQLSPETEMRVI